MTPDQSHVAGLELVMDALQADGMNGGGTAYEVLYRLLTQAKSAPAEPVQGEAVEVTRNPCEPLMAVAQHLRIVAALTAQPLPDAELVELLEMVRADGWYHPLEQHEIDRIDAKLASLRGEAQCD